MIFCWETLKFIIFLYVTLSECFFHVNLITFKILFLWTTETCKSFLHAIAYRYALCRAGMSLRFLTTSCSLRAVEHAHAFPLRWSSDNETRRPREEELTGARSYCVQTAIGYSGDYSSNPLVELAITPFTGKPIDLDALSHSHSLSFSSQSRREPQGAIGRHTRCNRDASMFYARTHTRDRYNGFVALSKRRKARSDVKCNSTL